MVAALPVRQRARVTVSLAGMRLKNEWIDRTKEPNFSVDPIVDDRAYVADLISAGIKGTRRTVVEILKERGCKGVV